jgi:hypothetical protein
MDRQEHGEDRAGAHKDADLGGVQPQREAIKRDQERIEIDIPHAEWPDDVKGRHRVGAGSFHAGRVDPWAGLVARGIISRCWFSIAAFVATKSLAA